jgi:coenzyme Q-binding protein COQ10
MISCNCCNAEFALDRASRYSRDHLLRSIETAMPEFQTRRRVPYSPAQMYALVADVERYPEFVPLCEMLQVRSRTPTPGGEVLIASMQVGYGTIRERFTSRVTLEPATPYVRAEYVDGPFHHLDNRWRFQPVGGGCEVDFFITYEFKSLMLQMLVGGMFDHAFRSFTEAFEARARDVYGPPAGRTS